LFSLPTKDNIWNISEICLETQQLANSFFFFCEFSIYQLCVMCKIMLKSFVCGWGVLVRVERNFPGKRPTRLVSPLLVTKSNTHPILSTTAFCCFPNKFYYLFFRLTFGLCTTWEHWAKSFFTCLYKKGESLAISTWSREWWLHCLQD